jgi:hypothetical protein
MFLVMPKFIFSIFEAEHYLCFAKSIAFEKFICCIITYNPFPVTHDAAVEDLKFLIQKVFLNQHYQNKSY